MRYFEKNCNIHQTVASPPYFYSLLRLGTADPSGVASRGSGGKRPGRRPWGRINPQFQPFKNVAYF